MAERMIFTYLSDAALDALIISVHLARSNLRFRADRDPKNRQLCDEYVWINRQYLTALAERTARAALSPEKRAELAAQA